jgi:hypothetical protein
MRNAITLMRNAISACHSTHLFFSFPLGTRRGGGLLHLMRQAISRNQHALRMHSASTQHALSMHSACNQRSSTCRRISRLDT